MVGGNNPFAGFEPERYGEVNARLLADNPGRDRRGLVLAIARGTDDFLAAVAAAPPGDNYDSPLGHMDLTTLLSYCMCLASNPAVPTQITIKASAGTPYIADTWGLNWLELPPGSYTVSFAHVQGWTELAPQTVTITAGNTTVVPATFTQRGFLRVVSSPAVAGTIFVDGIPRNDWGMWTDVPTGSHTVCFGAAAGYANTPACQTVTVNAGAETDVTGTYS